MKASFKQGERLAAVSLNPTARRLLDALNKETSIRWKELPDKTDSEWSKVARAVSILSLANLCEASPTRIRISDYGDRLLAELGKAGLKPAPTDGRKVVSCEQRFG